MGKKVTFLVFYLIFLFISPCLAANPLDVVINEIAWMGTKVSYNDEWIELYNNTNSVINLSGWKLVAKNGKPEINLSGEIPAKGFYLLERTDDETVQNIPADQIYTGALENQGENLELYDNFRNLVDVVNCSSGWFAGDNETKQTMERKFEISTGSDPGNWQTSQNSGGTPKAKNSLIIELPKTEPEPKLTPHEESQPKTQPEEKPKPIIYPSGIIINEILPSPEGPDEKEEWIEILNKNDFEVSLSGWKISDISGKIATYTFPKGTKISAKGFLVLFRPITKITLNNDGDSLNLTQPDGKIIDSVIFEKAPQGQSYNRTETGWVWSNTLTPGSENIIPKKILEAKKEKTQESIDEKGVAAIGKQVPRSLLVFLIALTIAIFSGVIILILKKRIKSGG